MAPPGYGPDESPLTLRQPPRLCGGAVRGSGASENRYPVAAVVVVVSVVIFVFPVPEVDIGRRLREVNGYPQVGHRHGVLVVFALSPLPWQL